jgi:ATP-dependent DNA helicase RecG
VENPSISEDYPNITGSVPQMIQATMERFRNNIIREKVIKVPHQMEAVRIFNYPYQAIEEAVVNAFYHRDYMSYEPVTIEIEPDCINIMNFPGIDRSISEKTIAEGKRFVSRYYRNRRLGEFLKELDLSEGHSSGIPTIQEELEKNGSPRAEFFTDEDRRAMRIRIPIHPAFIDEANFNQNERRLSEVLSEVLSKTDYEKLTPLIDYIEQNGSIKPKVASDICQKSPSTVRRYLNMLTQTGYVISEGKTSNMVYKARSN